MSSKKLILNVDTGVDDVVAIMLAVSAEARGATKNSQHQVLAILCTVGNVSVEQVYSNTLRVLQVCQRTDIPVYKGATCSLLGQQPNSDPAHIHGEYGLGGFCCSGGVSTRRDDVTKDRRDFAKHAAVALVDLANQYQGEIKLVSTAPLTNLALALRLDPSLGDKLAEVVIMGGNIEGRGRVTPCAEFNFHCDPEAAGVCLKELACQVTIIPYEVCLRSGLPWEWVHELIETRTKKAAFLRDSLSRAIHILKDVKKLYGLYLCDPLAVAYVIDTQVSLEVVPRFCTVELHGEYTRGQMVVDWAGITGNPSNVRIVQVVNVSVFQEMLATMASS